MRRSFSPLVLLVLAAVAVPLLAQQPEPVEPPAAEEQTATEQTALETAEPVPVARGPVPVPKPSEKAMRYYRGGNWLWFVNVIWGMLVPAVILFTGFSARIRDFATVTSEHLDTPIPDARLLYVKDLEPEGAS